LHRVSSQQQLQDRESNLIQEDESAPKFEKPRHLLQINDDEDDLAKQVMNVSPTSTSNP
jgi:hypothetical protein